MENTRSTTQETETQVAERRRFPAGHDVPTAAVYVPRPTAETLLEAFGWTIEGDTLGSRCPSGITSPGGYRYADLEEALAVALEITAESLENGHDVTLEREAPR